MNPSSAILISDSDDETMPRDQAPEPAATVWQHAQPLREQAEATMAEVAAWDAAVQQAEEQRREAEEQRREAEEQQQVADNYRQLARFVDGMNMMELSEVRMIKYAQKNKHLIAESRGVMRMTKEKSAAQKLQDQAARQERVATANETVQRLGQVTQELGQVTQQLQDSQAQLTESQRELNESKEARRVATLKLQKANLANKAARQLAASTINKMVERLPIQRRRELADYTSAVAEEERLTHDSLSGEFDHDAARKNAAFRLLSAQTDASLIDVGFAITKAWANKVRGNQEPRNTRARTAAMHVDIVAFDPPQNDQ